MPALSRQDTFPLLCLEGAFFAYPRGLAVWSRLRGASMGGAVPSSRGWPDTMVARRQCSWRSGSGAAGHGALRGEARGRRIAFSVTCREVCHECSFDQRKPA